MTSNSEGDRLAEAISDAIEKTVDQFMSSGPGQELSEIFSSHFVKSYYHRRSYLFILRYGCGVTSMGYAELRSLLRFYATHRGRNEINISFHSSRSLQNDLGPIWDTLVASSTEFNIISQAIANLYQSSHDPSRFARDYVQVSKSADFQKATFELIRSATDRICALHGPSLRGLIVLDAYYSTCAVSVSEDLTIDIGNIVGRAGYVHSAGPLLYIRSAGKFETDAFKTQVLAYISATKENHLVQLGGANATGKVPFFLVANEHLDQFDATRADSNSGVVQIRIPKDKYFIGGQPAADFWDALSTDEDLSKVVSLMPGDRDPHDEIAHFEKNDKFLIRQSLFLLRDFGIDAQNDRSQDQYLMLYARAFRNSSPFSLFDESKPGWYAPVTAPHTLTSAMLNLCLAGVTRARRKILICDPFVGSGTTALEALKFPGHVDFVGGDLSYPAELARRDNFAFFALPKVAISGAQLPDHDIFSVIATKIAPSIDNLSSLADGLISPELEKIVRRAIDLATTISPRQRPPNSEATIAAGIEWALTEMLGAFIKYKPDMAKTQARVRSLREFDFRDAFTAFMEPSWLPLRLMIYLCWRAILRTGYAFYREQDDKAAILTKALETEFRGFAAHCHLLGDIRKLRPEDNIRKLGDRLVVQDGWYSPEIIVPAESARIKTHRYEFLDHGQIDALKLLKRLEKKVDILITDPPYSFNTDHEESLALYQELPGAIVRSLKDDGQAVICLPEQSHNGQNIPSYARKAWFVRAFIAAAARDRAHVVNLGETRPAYRELYDAPHYWRSSRALTRAVLHFTIRRN